MRDFRGAVNVGLAAAAAFLALALALLSLRGLDGAVAAQSSRPFSLDLSTGFASAADHALGAKPEGQLGAARDLSRKAIGLSPYDIASWLRLSYIDVALNGQLGPAGIQALRRSYEFAPYDQYVDFWRIRFGLEHWAQLPPDLRRAVHAEVLVVASEPGHVYNLKKTLLSVRDPAGLLMAMVWMAQMVHQSGR